MSEVVVAQILAKHADGLLTVDELKELTGYRQAARAEQWLHERNWVYEPAARRGDWPKVLRSYRDERLSGKAATGRRVGPRLDFFNRRGT